MTNFSLRVVNIYFCINYITLGIGITLQAPGLIATYYLYLI